MDFLCSSYCQIDHLTSFSLRAILILFFLEAPKKTAEGLKKVQVGTGEQPTYGLESVALQHGVSKF